MTTPQLVTELERLRRAIDRVPAVVQQLCEEAERAHHGQAAAAAAAEPPTPHERS